MTIRLQEVVRSEVEGGLTGPANPIPNQSIDCGCGQFPCPKLAKFATRGLFVGLISWVGLIQAAGYAYFHVAGPTIARRFQFDPYLMDWILITSEVTPFLFGVLVAYWGDRFHRAAWIGGWVLIQSASYFVLIIPQLTHRVRVVEETDSATHMSLYADDSPEICSTVSSRIITEEDRPCYFTLAIVVVVQIVSGIARIVYYALGISYLDDNTKKRHVAAFIGVLLAVKIVGLLLGHTLAWICLRIDAETLAPISFYREQIGAWWLGFPILTVLLIVPGLLLSWFPRMLPSEVVERAAAMLLHSSGRYNRVQRRLYAMNVKASSPDFFPSIFRIFTNRILLCNMLALVLSATALLNFMSYENKILEARFDVPRPTGPLLGFDDPMSSRLVASVLKPIIIGLVVIISGLVIAKGRPSARNITGYSITMIIIAGAIIFALSFTACNKPPTVGTEGRGPILLLKYCNKDCGCSSDADFRPVCDSNGMFTFYSPCHAGCTSVQTKAGVTTYDGCRCVEEMTGKGNTEATDGPCSTDSCQISWLLFEFGTMLAYALAASTLVGDLLIILRSVKHQDKAVAIGFCMMWVAIVVNVPGKIAFEVIANLTCKYWGSQKLFCRLYDNVSLGDYLCYLTTAILALCILFKLLVWLFSKNLKLYLQPDDNRRATTEMQELPPSSTAATDDQPDGTIANNDNNNAEVIVSVEPKSTTSADPVSNDTSQNPAQTSETQEAPLKYGPLGPGDRRTDAKTASDLQSQGARHKMRSLDSEDELYTSSDEEAARKSSPKVAYKPLDLDSDVESDLSSVEPRSRRRVPSRDYDRKYRNGDRDSSARSSLLRRDFPNPDNYEDPRLSRTPKKLDERNAFVDGSSKTSSFEFSKRRQDDEGTKKGDFNEVGIPIVDPRGGASSDSAATDSRFLKDVKSLINRYEQNADQEEPDADGASVRSAEETRNRTDGRIVSGIPLVAMVGKRPSSRAHSSSGFSSLPDDQDSKNPDTRSDSRVSNNSKNSGKGSKGALCTDL